MIIRTTIAIGITLSLSLLLTVTGCGDSTPDGDGGAQGDAKGSIDAPASELGLPDFMPQQDRGVDPCANARDAVKSEAERINHCSFEGDCTSMPGSCPFGCYLLYNKQEDPSKLQQLIDSYLKMKQCPQCVYDCAAPGKMECNGSKCEMITFP